MNDPRSRTFIVLSILVLSLLGAACTPSSSTSEESAQMEDAASEVESTEAEVTEAAQAEAAPSHVAPTEAAPTKTAPTEAAPPVRNEPRFVTVSVPAGSELEVELLDPLSSGTSQVGDPVRARLAGELFAEGRRVASAGAELRGTVTEVVPLKKFGGQPRISVAFESLGVDSGDSVEIVAWLSEAGKKQAGRDAAKIGGAAAAGAVVGHQVDDDKGAEIGALIGGAIGTAIAAKTGKEIELVAGTLMYVVLENDAQVRVAD